MCARTGKVTSVISIAVIYVASYSSPHPLKTNVFCLLGKGVPHLGVQTGEVLRVKISFVVVLSFFKFIF